GTSQPWVVAARGTAEFRVVVVDLGVRASALRMLVARGIEVHVVPAESSAAEVLARDPDGVFVSNGPGDPSTMGPVADLIAELLRQRVPLFGICLGHQLLGRALGLSTHKMRHGHRGAGVPVVSAATGRVVVTSQNHGFVVTGEPGQRWDSEFGSVEVSHYCPNDDTVEGLRCLGTPAFSVQYHPDTTAASEESTQLFDEFRAMLATRSVSEQKEGN